MTVYSIYKTIGCTIDVELDERQALRALNDDVINTELNLTRLYVLRYGALSRGYLVRLIPQLINISRGNTQRALLAVTVQGKV